MKISKEQQKIFENQIKEAAKIKGWRRVSGSIYKAIGENFAVASYVIIEHKKIVFHVSIKKYVYDNIFWTIMNMKENINERESLRAIGAFQSPFIIIKENSYELTEDTKKLAEKLMDEIVTTVESFLADYDVAEYIFDDKNAKNIYNVEVLKCIAYIERQEYSCAKKMAQKAIAEGDHDGGYENEGKGFFDWTLRYLEKEGRKARLFG